MLLRKWQFRTVSDGIWCLEWPFSPSCFSQAVVWKFVSVVVWSGLLTFFKSTLIGLTFVFSTLSLKVMGNSVISLTCDTSDSVPGTGVFLACGDRATSGWKTHAGHYLSLTKTAKRAIKVFRIQGMPRQASTFFLRATVFLNSQCNNIWLLEKLKR